jgi:putative endonuclease
LSERINTQQRGEAAEAMARLHLEKHGLRLLAQNWRCRLGELDLVMLDADTVVFVEVRYRRYSAWGGAAASVDVRKREKLSRAAQLFLQQESRWAKYPCRFDVIAINADGQAPAHLDWIQNAFDT